MPAEQRCWRKDVYDQIRGVMFVQGGLSIERMCRLADVSRAGFYRSYEAKMPAEDELKLRALVQEIVLEHRQRYGYRRVTEEVYRSGPSTSSPYRESQFGRCASLRFKPAEGDTAVALGSNSW